ncbi:MAG: hypothetical protein WBD04_00675, partial [Candidatus Omnitrophota bacterium]
MFNKRIKSIQSLLTLFVIICFLLNGVPVSAQERASETTSQKKETKYVYDKETGGWLTKEEVAAKRTAEKEARKKQREAERVARERASQDAAAKRQTEQQARKQQLAREQAAREKA